MKITIIGIGLIGGSMALDLKSRGFCNKIIGFDRKREHCKKALELGIADEIKNLQSALNTDVVIISIPVAATAKLLPEILDNIGENTVVMDVGSTKQQICKSVKNHPKRKQFVATHPIAGTEDFGPSASQKNLFDNKTTILCDTKDSAPWAVEKITRLYNTLNMKILYMESPVHDMHVAYVSHISHISSFALATTVLEMEKNTATIFNLAGSGFSSTVRLAKSSPDMWAPIFKQNSKFVSKALNTYIKHLIKFKNNIVQKNENGMLRTMKKANAIRRVLERG